MKTLTKLLSIIFIIMLTQSCSKDSACKNTETNIYYNIADSNKAKIPYTGNDTLVFVSDQGDTATLIGQGKKTYYVKNTRNTSGNADCQWIENKNYENIEIGFVGNNQKLFKLYYRTAKSDFDPIKLTGIELIFNTQYRIGSTIENAFYFLNKDDSILLNGSYEVGGFMDKNKTLLYNNKLGVLKVNFSNNLWSKIK